jgi:hypothetical protein
MICQKLRVYRFLPSLLVSPTSYLLVAWCNRPSDQDPLFIIHGLHLSGHLVSRLGYTVPEAGMASQKGEGLSPGFLINKGKVTAGCQSSSIPPCVFAGVAPSHCTAYSLRHNLPLFQWKLELILFRALQSASVVVQRLHSFVWKWEEILFSALALGSHELALWMLFQSLPEPLTELCDKLWNSGISKNEDHADRWGALSLGWNKAHCTGNCNCGSRFWVWKHTCIPRFAAHWEPHTLSSLLSLPLFETGSPCCPSWPETSQLKWSFCLSPLSSQGYRYVPPCLVCFSNLIISVSLSS